MGLAYDTLWVSNVRAGLELLRQKNYDLLILDMGMPEMDTAQVVASIRQDPALSQLPILLMSAYPEGRHIVPHESVSGFISKPFMVSELLSTIKHILNEQRRGTKTLATAFVPTEV